MISFRDFICPTHGVQAPRIECKWCGHDFIAHRADSSLSGDGAGRAVQAPVFFKAADSLPLDLEKDQYQVAGDRFE